MQVAKGIEYAREQSLILDQSLQDSDGVVGDSWRQGFNAQAAEAIGPVRVESARDNDAIGMGPVPPKTPYRL